MLNIKPCYHCGKDNGRIKKDRNYSYVKCSNCQAVVAYEEDTYTAVALWNRQYRDSIYERRDDIWADGKRI